MLNMSMTIMLGTGIQICLDYGITIMAPPYYECIHIYTQTLNVGYQHQLSRLHIGMSI